MINRANSLTIDYSKLPNLRCPFCLSNTPIIKRIFLNNKTKSPELSILCKCFNSVEPRVIYLGSYLQFLFSKPTCFKHKNSLPELYCDICKYNMCSECASYHKIFKKTHKNCIIISNINNSQPKDLQDHSKIKDYWKFVNSQLKFNNYVDVEKMISKVYNEYNNYIEKEKYLIDQMISKLMQIKRIITSAHEKISSNNQLVVNLLRVIYHDFYKNNNDDDITDIVSIMNMKRIVLTENLINKNAPLFLEGIAKEFDSILRGICAQLNDMKKKIIFSLDDKDRELNNFTSFSNNKLLTTNDNTHLGVSCNIGEKTNLEASETIEFDDTSNINLNNIIQKEEEKKEVEKPQNTENKEINKNNEITNNEMNDNNKKEENQKEIDFFKDKEDETKNDIFKINLDEFSKNFPPSPSISTYKLFEFTNNENNIKNNLFFKKESCQDTLMDYNNNISLNFSKIDNSIIISPDDESVYQNDIFSFGEKNLLLSETGKKCQFILTDHFAPIKSIIQLKNNDSNMNIITAAEDCNILFWNSQNFTLSSKINLRKCYATAMTELSNGSIAIALSDFTIKIFSLPDLKITHLFIGHIKLIHSLIELDKKFLISACEDCSVGCWNLDKQICKFTAIEHEGKVNFLLKIKENAFATCSDDGTIKIWENFLIVKILKDQKVKISTLCMIKDNLIASGGDDGLIKIWDVEKGEMKLQFLGHNSKINKIVKMTTLENILLTVSDDKRLKIWDLESNKCTEEIEDAHKSNITIVMEMFDGKIITGGEDGLIKVWS